MTLFSQTRPREVNMSDEDKPLRRVRFYGANDLATGWYVPRVVELVERFDPQNVPTSTMDILELHNVQQYLEHELFPNSNTEEARDWAAARIPQIRSAVARHFSAVDTTTFAAIVAAVSHEYHGDLLELLGRAKAYERCDGATVLAAFSAAGVDLGDVLANKRLVQAYDESIRDALLASPRGAEYLVQKYLQLDASETTHLPASFTPSDGRKCLDDYIQRDTAHPNYVRLIATAKENPSAGIDARLKLGAKRRHEEMTTQLFARTEGVKTGCEVAISTTQEEPVMSEMDHSDGLVARYTYSRRWLDDTCDNPSILNNFIHLFKFVDDRQAMLALPSYAAHLGVMERLMGATGRTDYKTGAAFHATDMSTILQTQMYNQFLESKGIHLEHVISWFFAKYLVDEFAAADFTFVPSASGPPYLQKVRHLFAEMESVANQFSLFATDGYLDRDLLAIGSAQVRYKDIPSLLDGKYIIPSENTEIASVLHLIFSDQSTLNYINETLRADDAVGLLLENEVAYGDFEEHQTASLDHLIKLGVLEDTGTRIQLANIEQIFLLKALFTTQAANYYRL